MQSHVLFNESFLSKLGSAEYKTKTAELMGNYLRDKIREATWTDKILPPQAITRADCQISEKHDTLVYIQHVEPGSRAMSISLRGEPDIQLIQGKRFAVALGLISTLRFEKTEEELLVYPYQITKVIEDNSVKDMDEVKDGIFLRYVEAAIQALQVEANGGVATELSSDTVQAGTVVQYSARKGELASLAVDPNSYVALPIQKMDIVQLFQGFPDKQLSGQRMLMHDADFLGVFAWPFNDVGALATETSIEGYKYNTLCGYEIVRSLKPNILRRGNVYAFVAPDFLGINLTLGSTKFYVDKVFNKVLWQAWAMIGMGIGQVEGQRKLELYPCDASAADTQSLLSFVKAKDEDQLGTVVNRVDDGMVYPRVSTY